MIHLIKYPLYIVVTLYIFDMPPLSAIEIDSGTNVDGPKNEKIIRNNYWTEGKNLGPMKYLLEHKEGKFDRLRTKNVYSGYALIKQLGFTFKLSDIEQLLECNASSTLNQYECKILESHYNRSGLETPLLNHDGQLAANVEYYKVKTIKLKLKMNPPGLREAFLPNGIYIEISQHPLKEQSISSEEKSEANSHEKMKNQYWKIQLHQPYNLLCCGIVKQSTDLVSDILERLKTFTSVSSFLESITQNKGYSVNINHFSCKILNPLNNSSNERSSNEKLASSDLHSGFELFQSLNLSSHNKCPRWKLEHSIYLPAKEAFNYQGLIEEHCDNLQDGIVNTTISMSLSSSILPLINFQLEQLFIHNTTTSDGWESMVMTSPLMSAYVNGNWSSTCYSKSLKIVSNLSGQASVRTIATSEPDNSSSSGGITLENDQSLIVVSLLEARYNTSESSEFADFSFRVNKNKLAQLLLLYEQEVPISSDDLVEPLEGEDGGQDFSRSVLRDEL